MRGLATIPLVGSIPAEYLCFFDPLGKASMGGCACSGQGRFWMSFGVALVNIEQRAEEQDDRRNHQIWQSL